MLLNILLALLSFDIQASYAYDPRGYSAALNRRQTQNSSSSTTVDLGYSTYQGSFNSTTGLNVWRGIRFAAPPTGSNRWQAPQSPIQNRSSVIQADAYGSICAQSGSSNGVNATASNNTANSEDCLFLNVYAPANASGPLPVLVWIHGGGYGAGNGRLDFSSIINNNGNGFVGVSIQYRLGAFGFLSSDEVYRNGVVNAGLLDQHFALQWVQDHISLFGGNASQVTISGESAGGGSVMLQDMAYGGTLGTQLFVNTFSASPYLPMQYGYKDWIPSQAYYSFATEAGCPPNTPYGHTSQTIFECLVAKDSVTLINASSTISASGEYGTWAFLPVTDGTFVQDLPSQQLLQRKVNGLNALVGNNANEGEPFVHQNITTEDDLIAWIQLTFPLFTEDDIARLMLYYPSSNASGGDQDGPLYATNGISGASALNESSVGYGQQQRANNIYAETTFVCPSYWQAEAYSGAGKSAYKYQYSVVPATHGADVSGYFGPASPTIGPDLELAFSQILGRFVMTNNPSIPLEVAVGSSAMNSSSASTTSNPASNWPAFTLANPMQINLNETGGTPFSAPAPGIGNITEFMGPGLMNNITLVNAWTWEAGRGERCEFWRSVATIVPE